MLLISVISDNGSSLCVGASSGRSVGETRSRGPCPLRGRRAALIAQQRLSLNGAFRKARNLVRECRPSRLPEHTLDRTTPGTFGARGGRRTTGGRSRTCMAHLDRLAPRHNHAVRRARGSQWQGDRQNLPQAPPASAKVPARGRQGSTRGPGDTRRARQLRTRPTSTTRWCWTGPSARSASSCTSRRPARGRTWSSGLRDADRQADPARRLHLGTASREVPTGASEASPSESAAGGVDEIARRDHGEGRTRPGRTGGH